MTIAAFLLGGLAAFGASALATLLLAFVLPRCGHTVAGLQESEGLHINGASEDMRGEPVTAFASQSPPVARQPRKPRRRVIYAARLLRRPGGRTDYVRAERGDDVGELAANLARAGASILSGERQA